MSELEFSCNHQERRHDENNEVSSVRSKEDGAGERAPKRQRREPLEQFAPDSAIVAYTSTSSQSSYENSDSSSDSSSDSGSDSSSDSSTDNSSDSDDESEADNDAVGSSERTSNQDITNINTNNRAAAAAAAAVAETTTHVTADLICPITHELPFQPVMAQDGRIYERDAIEKHFWTKNHRENISDAHGDEDVDVTVVSSPMTNEPMGTDLLPSPQTKNLIQTLIDRRVIQGPLVDAWKLRLKQQRMNEFALKEANRGVPGAMLQVGISMMRAEHGFTRNPPVAFEWLVKAHRAGCVSATAYMGICLANGQGCPQKDPLKGMMHISVAAAKGSDLAAYELGMSLTKGKHGMAVDFREAIPWLKRALGEPSCQYKMLNEAGKDSVRQQLEEIMAAGEADELVE